jgi:hypothetical protein
MTTALCAKGQGKFALVADKPLTGNFNYVPTFTEVFSGKLVTYYQQTNYLLSVNYYE